MGHCSNHTISARVLEPLVWDKVVEILLDPQSLYEGYQQSLETEQGRHVRQRALLDELYRTVDKLELQGGNLTAAYTDPDIQMTKTEFIGHRGKIQKELKSIGDRIQELEGQLANIPTQDEFASLELFAQEIRKRITSDEWQPTPENKRRILELLHAHVTIGLDQRITLEGWFSNAGGLLNKPSTRGATRQPPLRGRV